ncbi:MAG: penicillin-binding protein 1B [Aestuariibacter sp.]
MKYISRPVQWFKTYFWKLSFVALAMLLAYGVYLDAQVTQRFSGNKWVVPAQLFARPLEIEVGQGLYREELVKELKLLGYRPVARITQSGEYRDNAGKFDIMRRAFEAAEGAEPQRYLQVTLKHGRVTDIRDLSSGEYIQSIRLEPMMVTRLVTQSKEDRILVSLQEVPETLINTLLHTEDRDFYSHFGVAPLAIARALVSNIKAGRTVQGGSTLTQQLAKNLFLSRERSLWRKANEAIMAIIMEIRYDKQEILETYLNEVFLGQKGNLAIHGFGLASFYYFNRPINELNAAEMATLVGMVKGPSYYNPLRYPERATERRDLILKTLLQGNYIDKTTYLSSIAMPLNVVDKGLLSQHKYPAFMDAVNRELRQILPNPELRVSGIKIFSTLDPLLQRAAEQAIDARLPLLEKRSKAPELNTALLATDYKKGAIRALVGDKDFAYRGFNRALDARRPVGSLIKPAVYLTALEDSQNYHLLSAINDKPITLKSSQGKLWQPQNVDKQFRGKVSLLEALSTSLNVPTVNLGMELGIDRVVNTLHRLGVESHIPSYPAITLGAVNLSPKTVNQMYQTIANQGTQMPLHTIRAVSTHDNQLLWQRAPEPIQTVDAKAAYLVNYALHKVTREGTAKVLKAQYPNIRLAGKTGTTDDYRDSWFTGIDNAVVTTVWVGNDDNHDTGLTGSKGAMLIYASLLKRAKPHSFNQTFPDGIGIAHFSQENFQRLTPGCQQSVSVPADLHSLPEPVGCTGQPKKEKKSFWDKIFGS